jgi:hypothetical protein
MGNCASALAGGGIDEKVKKGTLDKTCFEEHRALGKGGFGTVLAVTKKFGPANEKDDFHAMKRLDKKRIVECRGMDVLVMSELHFMIEISDDHSKSSDFLMKLECAFQDKAHVYLVGSIMDGGDGLFVQNSFPGKKLPLDVARWLTASCLLGLDSLHNTHNLLHRDIKEENLLIDSTGYVAEGAARFTSTPWLPLTCSAPPPPLSQIRAGSRLRHVRQDGRGGHFARARRHPGVHVSRVSRLQHPARAASDTRPVRRATRQQQLRRASERNRTEEVTREEVASERAQEKRLLVASAREEVARLRARSSRPLR